MASDFPPQLEDHRRALNRVVLQPPDILAVLRGRKSAVPGTATVLPENPHAPAIMPKLGPVDLHPGPKYKFHYLSYDSFAREALAEQDRVWNVTKPLCFSAQGSMIPTSRVGNPQR